MNTLLRPIPQLPLTVRPATLADVPFMDSLQKLHSKQVGWMPTKQFEGKIQLGQVLVAEASLTRRHGDTEAGSSVEDLSETPCLRVEELGERRVGYVISSDRYFKRDDVGIVYQVNVVPGKQRGLIGATLLQAVFDRAAYGCKLFCCWCAQDIAANHFWQSMGFVPLAYRAGSEKKSRVHIFWQKRIRRDDVTTPWWFPAKTDAGAMREDRLVLPIPPGVHWSGEMPVLGNKDEGGRLKDEAEARKVKGEGKKRSSVNLQPSSLPAKPAKRPRVQFGPPSAMPIEEVNPSPEPAAEKPVKPKRETRKADPKLVAAARELRDRYLEHVNANGLSIASEAKYEVGSKRLESSEEARPTPLLIEARAA